MPACESFEKVHTPISPRAVGHFSWGGRSMALQLHGSWGALPLMCCGRQQPGARRSWSIAIGVISKYYEEQRLRVRRHVIFVRQYRSLNSDALQHGVGELLTVGAAGRRGGGADPTRSWSTRSRLCGQCCTGHQGAAEPAGEDPRPGRAATRRVGQRTAISLKWAAFTWRSPNRHLLVSNGRVVLSDGPTEHGHRPATNLLFCSVALAYLSEAVGVLMSGVLTTECTGWRPSAPAAGSGSSKHHPTQNFLPCRSTR
jgi:hypothetical protein